MRRSLRIKMLVTFSLVVLVSCVTIAIISYSSSVNLVKNSLSDMGGNIVQRAETLIDKEQFHQITPESGETDYYHELRETLNLFRETTGLNYLYTMNRKEVNGEYEYYYVVDGMPIEEASALGDTEDISDYPAMEKAFETGTMQVEMTNTEEWGALVTTYHPIKTSNGDLIGIIGADLDATDVYETMSKDRSTLFLYTLVILVISLAIIFYFTTSLLKPLKTLTDQVQRVGEGDLSTEIQIKRTDEIGMLACAVTNMQQSLRTLISDISQVTETVSQQGEALTQSSQQVKKDSNQVAATMQELASGADVQSRQSSDLTNTMNEFHKQIEKANEEGHLIAESSTKVLEMTNQGSKHMNTSVHQMETIHTIMNHAVEKVQGLDQQAQEVSQLVVVIKGIAEQTNLLALNAAIEAARAGEQGKGFAVVANEVRKLAEQVSGSVENITSIVTTIQQEAKGMSQSLEEGFTQVIQGSNQMKITGETFGVIERSVSDMVESITTISKSFGQINQKTNQIHQTLEEVAGISEESASGIEQTSSSVQRTNHAMEEISGNAHSLFTLAEKLNEMIKKFKLS